MEVHIVQKGDTLWKISRQHGVSFDELKRVNAHLANPDYIVPGMKIFLPEKSKGHGEPKKKKPSHGGDQKRPSEQHKPQPDHHHKKPTEPHKRPVEKPAPVRPTPPIPVPFPETEEELTLPKPPPAVPESTLPKPVPTPMPDLTPTLPPPQPNFSQPALPPQPMCPPPQQPVPMPMSMIGIPCGWMPIYDADCFPMVHPGQMHTQYESPMQPMPYPLPTPQLPVESELPPIEEEVEEMGPVPLPEEMSPEEFIMTDSHEYPAEEPPEGMRLPVPPPLWEGESYNYPPQYETPASPCGCSPTFGEHDGYHPMPMPMPMSMPRSSPCPPVNHCNACMQPIHPVPYGMMPYPSPFSWHGGY